MRQQRGTDPFVVGQRVAEQPAADSRGAAVQAAGDLSDTDALSVQRSDALPFDHGQVPVGTHRLSQPERHQPAEFGACNQSCE